MKFEIVDHGSNGFYQALALRDEVLRAPLGLFFSGEDILAEKEYHHFILSVEGRVLATAQMLPIQKSIYKMRQVAVDFEFQSQGLGSKLIEFIENWSVNNSIDKIVLHARETAIEFYKKRRYEIIGDVFTEVGIPHFFMEKHISS